MFPITSTSVALELGKGFKREIKAVFLSSHTVECQAVPRLYLCFYQQVRLEPATKTCPRRAWPPASPVGFRTMLSARGGHRKETENVVKTKA